MQGNGGFTSSRAGAARTALVAAVASMRHDLSRRAPERPGPAVDIGHKQVYTSDTRAEGKHTCNAGRKPSQNCGCT